MRSLVPDDPAREDDVPLECGMGRMTRREDQLLVPGVVQDPDVGGRDDPFLIDLVAEATPARAHRDDVAPAQKVDIEEGMRVRYTVPGECGRPGLAGKRGAGVMAGAECEHRRSDALVSGLVEVE